jgi:hypothetical protein
MGGDYKVTFRLHAVKRMAERNIEEEEVVSVVNNGEVIERYPDDKPFPSFLMLGLEKGRPLHVVVAVDEKGREKVVVTVYEPDGIKWSRDFRERRKS